MNRISWSIMLAVLVVAAGGCSFQGSVNSTYFQYAAHNYDKKVAGMAAVEMPRSVQDEVFVGKPTSFTGGGTTLSLPLGSITREAASLAFRDVFSQGAKVVDSAQGQTDLAAVLRPKVTRFSYEYNQLKNAGFAITPTAVISLSVTLADPAGKTIWERKFDSGNFEGQTYVISGSPGEEISKTTHQAMMKIMQDAADAVQQYLIGNPLAPAKGEKSL